MRASRVWVTALVLILLVAAMFALNSLSMRPKPPPDVPLEGRLALRPPTPTSNEAEAPEASNVEPEATSAGPEAQNKADAEPPSEAPVSVPVQPPKTKEEKAIVKEAKGSVVKLVTDKGDIYLDLYDDKTPITVGNFLELVGRKFYNGLTFHRVIPNFMIQGGDPAGNGTGGPGFTIPDEADKGLKHLRGSLSMAKTQAPNSGGSQFFICHSPQPHLDGVHTVFGECVKGMDVVDKIAQGDKIKEAIILKKSDLADDDIAQAKKARVPD